MRWLTTGIAIYLTVSILLWIAFVSMNNWIRRINKPNYEPVWPGVFFIAGLLWPITIFVIVIKLVK